MHNRTAAIQIQRPVRYSGLSGREERPEWAVFRQPSETAVADNELLFGENLGVFSQVVNAAPFAAGRPGTVNVKELENPKFLEWLRATQAVPIEPDDEDMEFFNPDSSDEVLVESYRVAGVLKLMRLYRRWLASQN